MNTERRRRLCQRWTLLVFVLASPAQAGSVAVLPPTHEAPEVMETLNRVHGELLAVGLSMEMVGGSPEQSDESRWVAALQKEQRFDAAIVVREDSSPPVIDVWFLQDPSGSARLARISVDAGTRNAPEKLAIQAVDVLRSQFLENDLLNEKRQLEPPPVNSPRTETPPSEPAAARLGFAAGIASLMSLDGVGPQLMPTAQLDFAATPALAFQAAIGGLGTRSLVTAEAYEALVERSRALLGARYFFATAGQVRPFAELALGVASTTVEGRAAMPASGHQQTVRSLLIDAGVGLDWRWLGRYYSTLAAQVELANPSTSVHIADSVVATSGRPDLALTLALGAFL